MTKLSEIIELLPSLSRGDLQTVVFHAQTLMSQSSIPTRTKGAVRAPSAKPKVTKGQAQPVSKWEGLPEYASYKKADKALKAKLKESDSTLKDLQVKDPEDPVLVEFLKERNQFFQAKARAEAAPVKSQKVQRTRSAGSLASGGGDTITTTGLSL